MMKSLRIFSALRPMSKRFLALRQDVRGNVLILTALTLVPLTLLVGSAMDIGRAQLAQSRLQAACDAASLAGRRAMSAGRVDAALRAEAVKFFRFNFPVGSFGTAAFDPAITTPADAPQTVMVKAETAIPNTILRMVGQPDIAISAKCSARHDLVNTDIVLALDVTGSMKDPVTPGGSGSRMQALRDAVLAFYREIEPMQKQLASANLRLRIGIVPYSSSVNVGKAIYDKNPSYMVSGPIKYFTRVLTKVEGPDLGYWGCQNVGYRRYHGGECLFFTWKQAEVDVSRYVAGETVRMDQIIGSSGFEGSIPKMLQIDETRWAGCIEERQTSRIPSAATVIPNEALDLDIARIPSDQESRWRPYWPEVSFMPGDRIKGEWEGKWGVDPNKPQVACPLPAQRMGNIDELSLIKYLYALHPDGGTYHDLGMMWAARWAAPQGIFGDDNPDVYNGVPVRRHIIFMTDGLMDTGYDSLYSSYGIEKYDARVTPGGESSDQIDQKNRHKTRFRMLCARAKEKPLNYSIWVIAFATALDADLTQCASTPGQASTVADAEALTKKFAEIGKKFGALRLSR